MTPSYRTPHHHLRARFCLLAIVAIFCAHAMYFNFVCDDAYISFHYAKHLAEGHGLVYNMGERVEGYTNFLWVVLLAGLLKLGVDVVAASKVLGIAFGCVTIVLAYELQTRAWNENRYAALVAPALLASSSAFAAWATGGREAQMFTCLVFLGVVLSHYEVRRPPRFSCAGIVCGLAALTRPEGVLVFAVLACYRLVGLRKTRRSPLRETLRFSAPFLLFVVPHFLWRLSFYGYPFPNSFYAKDATESHLSDGLGYLLSFLRRFSPIVVMLCPLIGVITEKRKEA